jgi:glucose-1-phosphate thymidylyltransferase
LNQTLKIVIPMAGWGTRMRPHTWSKPKPLVSVAGKTSLEHVMAMFDSVPASFDVEYIFIVGPYLGEMQIPPFVESHFPGVKFRCVTQHEMKGQSHALYLAKEYLTGPMIMCFSDTLMDTDFRFLAEQSADAVAWVKPVEDPRRFGVAELDESGRVTRFIEKPQGLDNNLVVVGCYYFKDAAQLLTAIETQIAENISLKNEFFLTDAISIMIKQGAHVRTQSVDVWLDTGTIEATLETNRYMLDHGKGTAYTGEQVTIVPPVAIHPSAQIVNSTIGPHVSIGANCQIRGSQITDSILEDGVTVSAVSLTHSLIGRQAGVEGKGAHAPVSLNIGDNSQVKL